MHAHRSLLLDKCEAIVTGNGTMPPPGCQPTTYAALLRLAVRFLRARVAPQECLNVAEAIHAAYQLGRLSVAPRPVAQLSRVEASTN